jgi:hypothetical protein
MVSPPGSTFTKNFTPLPSDAILKAQRSHSNTSPLTAHGVTTSPKSCSSAGFQYPPVELGPLSQPSTENTPFYDLEGEFADLFFKPSLNLAKSDKMPSAPPPSFSPPTALRSHSAALTAPTPTQKAANPGDNDMTADISLIECAVYEADEVQCMAKAIRRLEHDVRRMAAEIEVLQRLISRGDGPKDVDTAGNI